MITVQAKPLYFSAMQWDGSLESTKKILLAVPNAGYRCVSRGGDKEEEIICIHAEDGERKMHVWDWVIKDVDDTYQTVRPDVFERNYERVQAPVANPELCTK